MSLLRLSPVVIILVAWACESARADVGDPQLRTDHPWYPGELACSTFERLFATQAAAYRRVVGVEPQSEEQKALAAWFWRNTHYYHAEDGRQDLFGKGFAHAENWTREYWTGLFGFGFALCGTTHAQWTAEMEQLLGHARCRTVGVDGHSSFEVFLTGGPYGKGKWVLLDHDISTVIFNPEGLALLSIAEIKADLQRLTDRRFAPERQHGWLVSGLHPEDAAGVYTKFNSAAYLAGYAGPPPVVHLRRGETLRRYLQPGLEDGKTFVFWGRNYNALGIPGPERDRTWVNQPEKMRGSCEGTPARRGQARYGNAVYTYRPNFTNGDYREGVVNESDRHVTFAFATPYLIGATPPNAKEWGIHEAGCTNGLVLRGNASCPVAVSVDRGRSWRDCGKFQDGMDLTDHVKAQRQYLLRLGASAGYLAGTGLTMITVCQANAAVLPRLKDGGSRVHFESSGAAVVSAGPTVEQARTHLVAGGFQTPDVTLELATPHREPVVSIYAAAHMASGNPPGPEIHYSIEFSTDCGKTWKPVAKDWTITRRGQEPRDFWSQSFCYGAAELAERNVSSVRVRSRNTGGKLCLRTEVHLVYRTKDPDPTKVTFDWADDTGVHRDTHVFKAGKPGAWEIKTGRNVQTRWVEFEPLTSSLAADDDLARQLRELSAIVLPADSDAAKQLARHAQARLQEANWRESLAWQQIQSRADWEKYRDPRLQALRDSLGKFPPVPRDLKARVTRTLDGDGYRIENLVFESRPGLVVTANRYLPRNPSRSMPGILICPSHHNPKTQDELQDMGIIWSRLGCVVLVMDQLGHGERRQHPFHDASTYSRPFRVGRQDYYFRYNVGLQLSTIGDSLMGWMVWDLHRGVDLLLAQPGIDPERIILLGAVAGGGDPAAVAAALDPRIAAVVPFNFGGPQPETVYPLPADAEGRFNYAGSGSWESTRNLRRSARDGFLPWVIVGVVAPRRLIYAHEFAWDRERDPVWRRLERIYRLFDAPDHLASVQGRGKLSGKPPDATHCNNIGAEHRQGIYPVLKRWFDMPPPDREKRERRPAKELICLPAETVPRPVHELAAELGAERAVAARQRRTEQSPEARRKQLCQDWARLLGSVEPAAESRVSARPTERLGNIVVERISLEVESPIVVPLLVLIPQRKPDTRLPIVVAFAQHGKQAFLKERSGALVELLQGGVAVCLLDLRGTGETRPAGDTRGRASAGTSLSATELMLGQTLVGARLRDLRAVLGYLRGRAEVDPARVGLWGDSFAPVNPDDRNLEAPLDADRLPDHAEPAGALLALLGALFEDGVEVVNAEGGLAGYHALLESQFCYVPHDVVVPGALTAGDLCDVAAAVAPRSLRLADMVDGRNRRMSADRLAKIFSPAQAAYNAAEKRQRFVIEPEGRQPNAAARWLRTQLQRK